MQKRIVELEKANKALHAEILERNKERHRINRYNSVLEGINRIFGSIVKAETKEELGIACLSVAIDVTGSQIGFVGEVGADGRIHDIVIGNSGWNQCLMYDKSGHCHRPGDYLLHGLYGRVIDSGKGFFTNDPPSHPDSIGLPDGYLPLKSFLGIPLILDGKTMGLIAVANRESGYSLEQQEDLEAIAPAVVQVLKRQRGEEQGREKIEEALRESRTKLETALASVTDAVLISDAQGRLVDFNDAFATFHRFKNREEFSKTFAKYPDILDVFMADGIPAPVDMWAVPRALRGEVVTDAEYILRRKDTGETWVGSYSFAPIRDKDGAIVGSVVIGRDITERKQAEEALREAYEEIQMQSEELQASNEELQIQSEELQTQAEELEEAYEALSESEKRYRLLFDQSLDAIILTDPRNGEKILSANPAACHMFGWSERELIGKGRDVILDLADPALSILLDERARSGSAKAQLTYRRKDGTTFPGEVSTTFFVDNNGEPRTVAIIRDITERKWAEEALSRERSLLESVMQTTDFMLVFFDPQFNFVWVNPAYAEACKMKPEEMIGKNHFALYPHAENKAIFRKVRDTGEGTFYKDKPFVYPDQPERGVTYWDWSLVPVKDPGGNVTGLVLSLRETTKYKQAEEALRKSEGHYRMLFTNMTEAFFLAKIIYDKNGKPCDYRFLEVNPAYELNMGIKKEQILGKTVLEVFPNVNPMVLEKYREVAVSGKPMHFEIFSHAVNKHFEVYAFSHEKGEFAVILRDITERKEAEAKLKETLDNLDKLVKERTAELEKAYNLLKESEERYRIVVERTEQLVYDYDLRTDKGGWTGAIEEITGHIAEEFQKFDRAVWIENIHPDDRENIIKCIREARKTGKTFQEELRFRKKDGNYIYIENSGVFLLNEKGIPYRSLGVIKDVTERKLAQQKLQQSEEKYRSFIQNFKGIAFQLDKDLNLEFIHGAVKEITGYTEEELVFDGWKQAILPEDLDLLLKENKKARSLDNYHGEFDYRIRSKDGSIKWVHDIHQKIPGKNGKAEVYTGIIYDITEKKEAEEALAKIDEARIKEIHHRIKNNLQVISSLLSLEAEKFNDPKMLEAFKESQNRVASMALIHEELFRGKGTDDLDFAAYIQKLTKELFSSYNLRNEDLSLKLKLEQVYLDMDTSIPLGIIVNELVSNSLKHAFPDENKWEISITLKKIEDFNTNKESSKVNSECNQGKDFQYKLTVADNGRGIPEKIDFKNVDSLGLQLVNILVEQIDGCIELKRDHGTEFTIWFNNIEK